MNGRALAILGLLATSLQAQVRSDTLTTSYESSGIRVIHRRSPGNDIVAANVYLLGGSRQITFANAGIEPLILAVSERGTTRFTREQLRRQLARTGSTIVVSANHDWSMIGLRTTVAAFRETWTGFADRIVAPRLDSTAVAIERDLTVSALAQRRDSPDAWAEHLADSVAYAGHPYGIDPIGTVQSVSSLTTAKLRTYHRAQFVKSRLYLVIVGNIPQSAVDSLVAASLGKLPAGTYTWALPDTLPRRATMVFRDNRPLATNYLIGYAPGPRADDPDYDAARVATAILSGRLFAEVRSRQTLTYAVNAPFEERAVSSVGLYVSTTNPVAALAAMREEIRGLQEGMIDGGSLGPLVQQFLTQYFLENETNAAQADFLLRTQLFDGDWRKGSAFRSSMAAVSPSDIQRVMRRYYRDINFAYVGEATRLPDSALRGY